MSSDKTLEVIEQILQPRSLNSIERFVLCQSWDGKTYNEMAQICNYGSVYIKEIGSHLWHDLSQVLGRRVTKKNLHLVISDYQQNHTHEQYKENLAQLASWHFFNTYLKVNWQRWMRELPMLSLILCDIDYFKFYRDAHGQIIGDACIHQIANVIDECVRHQAMIAARCEETKFAALLPYTDAAHASEIAEQIRKQVKALGLTHDQSKLGGFPSQFVTVSVGIVSTTLDPHSSPAKLMAAAEEALSIAKRGGRDRVAISQELEKAAKSNSPKN